ncbi:MAG: carbohydrate kinase [Clostridia bacterium]|nr:carbohydrate kinase [Clostridia bacterium]
MKIAGLDIGTTGCKLTVFDETGVQLVKAYRDYPVRRTVNGHEIDASAMMESVYAVIKEIAEQHPDVAGIGVTSFGETFVMTDIEGNPLHNAMLYTDPRGSEEREELERKLGAEVITNITGLVPHEMYSISKIMWIKKHMPETYKSAARIQLIEDFVVRKLTGKSQINYSLASRTMAFDFHTLTWSEKIFNAAGIDTSLMSKPVPMGTSAGTITRCTAQLTGLNENCVIVSACHDQVSAVVGAGVFDGSAAVDGAGTVECITPVYDSLPDISVMAKGRFSVVPYVIPGKYVAYAFLYTGGALIKWAMDTFGKGETNESMEEAYGRDEPTGLLVLPHFEGAATPYMDIGSKGAIIGLMTSTTAADLYRACMEGVVYEMRLNYESLSETGVRFKKLIATGGGAKSKIWMQMKADVLNLPITVLDTVDAGTIGSAMLTGIAVGLFKDLESAAACLVRKKETYYPRAEMHEKYMKIYERYKKVYNAVRPLI